ncbi:hypothetical protein FOA52_011804 [Chlamydomonas sp. UWO 241]|nr:hypothetical protein FOA52_011804 [Chlamydomonas sp. UWO 241]
MCALADLVPGAALAQATADEATSTLYFGNLHPYAYSRDLEALFEHFGRVEGGVKLVKDRASGVSAGYGFVKFANKEDAEAALQTLNGTTLMGLELRVNWALPNSHKEDTGMHYHVFVGDLGSDVSDAMLYNAFCAVGQCSDARVMWDHNAGRSKGYGFVSFRRREDAEGAIERMQGQLLGSRRIRVSWAQHKQDEMGPPPEFYAVDRSDPCNTNVYIGNIASETTESDLITHFSEYGPVAEVKLHKKGGYCFVKYEQHDSAVRAIVGQTTKRLHNRVLKAHWGKNLTSTRRANAAAATMLAAALSATHIGAPAGVDAPVGVVGGGGALLPQAGVGMSSLYLGAPAGVHAAPMAASHGSLGSGHGGILGFPPAGGKMFGAGIGRSLSDPASLAFARVPHPPGMAVGKPHSIGPIDAPTKYHMGHIRGLPDGGLGFVALPRAGDFCGLADGSILPPCAPRGSGSDSLQYAPRGSGSGALQYAPRGSGSGALQYAPRGSGSGALQNAPRGSGSGAVNAQPGGLPSHDNVAAAIAAAAAANPHLAASAPNDHAASVALATQMVMNMLAASNGNLNGHVQSHNHKQALPSLPSADPSLSHHYSHQLPRPHDTWDEELSPGSYSSSTASFPSSVSYTPSGSFPSSNQSSVSSAQYEHAMPGGMGATALSSGNLALDPPTAFESAAAVMFGDHAPNQRMSYYA